ncbi:MULTISPECIES: hypothetical protein [Streptomyces]|uniref:Uncharacterized protein n=1 Tax=Streptomyces pini TaxID=1520580 RepID=A0A1I4IYU1_9ACTN|nr:hypothetical protein [Streptomyces pini]SFL59558.1 hypothetical protein SAMN05192584_12252 [Streptomyces pini]
MNVKKVVLYVLLVFILYSIIASPDRSTELVGIGFEAISSAAKSVGAFMSELVN